MNLEILTNKSLLTLKIAICICFIGFMSDTQAQDLPDMSDLPVVNINVTKTMKSNRGAIKEGFVPKENSLNVTDRLGINSDKIPARPAQGEKLAGDNVKSGLGLTKEEREARLKARVAELMTNRGN